MFIYQQDAQLPKQLQSLMAEWRSSFEQPAVMAVEEETVKRKVTIRQLEVEPEIPFLFDRIKKKGELETLIASILLGEPIFVISSNKTILDLVFATLEIFTPHKSLRKIAYTNEPVQIDEADLVGIDRGLARLYKNEVILNLDKGRVSAKESKRSAFVANLLRQIKGQSQKNAERIVRHRMFWVLDHVSKLIVAFAMTENQAEREEIIEAVKKEGAEALDIVVEIAAATNPLIAKVIRAEMSVAEKFSGWMMDL